MIDQYGLYGEGQGPKSVLEEAFKGVVIGKVTKKKKSCSSTRAENTSLIQRK